MNTAVPLARRPLSCCIQAATRQTWSRFASTATATAPTTGPVRFHPLLDKRANVRSAFAVYAPPPKTTTAQPPASASASASSPSPSSPQSSQAAAMPSETLAAAATKTQKVHAITAYDQQQIRRMDPTGARTLLFSRKNPDAAKPGDVLLVTPSKAGAEGFAGVCLAIRRTGIETAILLRGQLAKTGVEMWFKIYSRAVAAIDIIERRPKRARRAKLTYMRMPAHDRGSVEDLVKTWRRGRNALRTKSNAVAATGPRKYVSKKK